MKAVYFLCNDLTHDPVAPNVYKAVNEIFHPVPAGFDFESRPVMKYHDTEGNVFYFAETNDTLSHYLGEALPVVEDLFGDCDFAGVVNWHEGASAPDKVFTVHATGDVSSGHFGKTAPFCHYALFLAMEKALRDRSLDEKGWTVWSEATHFSGMLYAQDPALLEKTDLPFYDIEIGSTAEAWANEEAAATLAEALVHAFDVSADRPAVVLAFGDVHFSKTFSEATLAEDPAVVCAVHLPNQWLVSGRYENEDGFTKAKNAAACVKGGIDGVVFHEGLAGPYKKLCRELAEELSVPVFKHKVLRDPKRLQEALGNR